MMVQGSPSHRRYSRTRRKMFLTQQKDRFTIVPGSRFWLLNRLCDAVVKTQGPLHKFILAFLGGIVKNQKRNREIFPLPPVLGDALRPPDLTTCAWRMIRRFVCFVICTLNVMYGISQPTGQPDTITAAQSGVHFLLVSRTVALVNRMQRATADDIEGLLPDG
jgi:hypothetical protein